MPSHSVARATRKACVIYSNDSNVHAFGQLIQCPINGLLWAAVKPKRRLGSRVEAFVIFQQHRCRNDCIQCTFVPSNPLALGETRLPWAIFMVWV